MELAVGAPFEDAVIGLVGEKDIAGGITRWSFGKRKVAGKTLEDFTRGDDIAPKHARAAKEPKEKKWDGFHNGQSRK
jgi:hypothetical protein